MILFAIVFGMSMDYEVLLVSRIHEEYKRTGNNRHAIAEGLERSGRLITGAAAITVAVFLAIAVTLDAALVRAIIVPAVMRIVGDFNWWASGFLRQLQQRVGLEEHTRDLVEEVA